MPERSHGSSGSIRLAPRWTSGGAGNGRRPRPGTGLGRSVARRPRTGLSRPTITAGLRELDQPIPQRAAEAARVRRPGGGRRPLTETDPGLLAALESLLEPVTRGDPMSPLRWTCKSTRRLAEELTRQGASRGAADGGGAAARGGLQPAGQPQDARRGSHPDRNAQFEYINASVGPIPGARPARDLGGHEEEGTGRRLQERRSRVASRGEARGGPGPRLPRQDPGQGDPLQIASAAGIGIQSRSQNR